jgi:hypothetical protein
MKGSYSLANKTNKSSKTREKNVGTKKLNTFSRVG